MDLDPVMLTAIGGGLVVVGLVLLVLADKAAKREPVTPDSGPTVEVSGDGC